MAQELRIALPDTGKADVVAQIIDSTLGKLGADIPMPEVGVSKVYIASIATLDAGTYTIRYEDTLGFLGSAQLIWDGTKELDFSNIEIDVTVAGETVAGAVGIPTILADIDGTKGQNDNVLRFLFDEMQAPILYLLGDYLASQGHTIDEVIDALFVIKEEATDEDGDALYSKFLSDTEIVVDLTTSSISILIVDYVNFKAGGRYFLTLGIKYAGDTQFREVPCNKQLIEFRQDVIRA